MINKLHVAVVGFLFLFFFRFFGLHIVFGTLFCMKTYSGSKIQAEDQHWPRVRILRF